MIRKIADSFVETRIDGEAVLVNVDRGHFHALKGTGLATWELIDGTRDRAAIVAELTRQFDVAPDRCDAEVGRFLDQVSKAGFVALD